MITTKNLIEVRDSIIEKSIEGLRQYGHVEPVAFLLLPENGKVRPLAISIRNVEESGQGFDFLKIIAHEKGAIGFILVAEAMKVNKQTQEAQRVVTINFETKLMQELISYDEDLALDEAMPIIKSRSCLSGGDISGVLFNFNLN